MTDIVDASWMSRSTGRVIRDPVHDYVYLPNALERLLEHPYLQRLRRISQTSMSSSVYPSMTGRRFEHSLGAMHLAQKGWYSAWANCDENTKAQFRRDVRSFLRSYKYNDPHTTEWINSNNYDFTFPREVGNVIAAAALLHDVGHPPFSHALEPLYSRIRQAITPPESDFARFRIEMLVLNPDLQFHEIAGLYMTSQISAAYHQDRGVVGQHSPGIAWSVVRAILESTPERNSCAYALKSLISGDIDMDRLDYLIRDTVNSGTQHGSFDLGRIIYSIELHPGSTQGQWKMGFGLRARSALETFLVQRYQYYRWVVYHYHTIAANRILDLAVDELLQLKRDHGSVLFDSPFDLCYYAFDPRLADDPIDAESEHKLIVSTAVIDDNTIDSLLEDALSKLSRHSIRAALLPREIRFVALAEAFLFRKPNWASLWKTESDYLQICEALGPRLQTLLLQFERALVARREQEDELASRIDDEIDTLRRALWRAQVPREFVNAVAGIVAGGSSRLGPRSIVEGQFAASLTEASQFGTVGSAELSDCFWLVAYNEVFPWKAEAEAITVYHEGRASSLLAESPALDHLASIESERPKLCVFALSPSLSRVRDGRQSIYQGELLAVFMDAFPRAVERTLSKRYRDLNLNLQADGD